MTQKIYEQHEAAFAHISAFVIAKDGERVATIAFKFPRDGAGRLYTYVHWLGVEMVRGYAGGYGYDKRSAAVSVAAHNLERSKSMGDWAIWEHTEPEQRVLAGGFMNALKPDDGMGWDRRLRDAGFDVWQAV